MTQTLITVAGFVFVVVTVAAIAFQLALAFGAPWGSYAMGGAYPGRFPPRLRVLALVQAAVLAILAATVASRAGLVEVPLLAGLAWPIWLVIVFSTLSLILNASSRSAGERRIWVPVAIVMLATSLLVAVGPA